jgi:hypothetical protein
MGGSFSEPAGPALYLFPNRLPAFPTRVAFGLVPGAGRPFQRIVVFPLPVPLLRRTGRPKLPPLSSTRLSKQDRAGLWFGLASGGKIKPTPDTGTSCFSQWKRLLKRLPNLGARNKSMSRVGPFGDPASAAVCPPPSDGKHRRTNGGARLIVLWMSVRTCQESGARAASPRVFLAFLP